MPCTLKAYSSDGRLPGTPSMTLARPFSAFFSSSQLGIGVPGGPNTWGWRATSLSWTPRATSARVNCALLGGQGGVEDDLEQQVAELLLEVVVAVASVQLVDGLEDLVGLLEQVAGEAAVGLRLVPRAAGPQGAHQLGEAGQLGRHRLGQGRDPQAGQVVGLDARSRSAQATVSTRSSGRPRRCSDRHLRARRRAASLMSDSTARLSHWATRSGPAGRPPRPRSGARRPGGRPRRPGRRRGGPRPGRGTTATGTTLDLDPRVGPQQLDRALGDQRRAGHGVEDLAVRARRRRPGLRRCRRTPRRSVRPARRGRRRTWPARPARRWDGGVVRTNRVAMAGSMASAAATLTSRGSPGPRPTTTTRPVTYAGPRGRRAATTCEVLPRAVGGVDLHPGLGEHAGQDRCWPRPGR